MSGNKMKILIACEESQRVCIEFRNLGHEAFSCDILPCSGDRPEWHILSDVYNVLQGYCTFYTCDGELHYIDKWDMIIGFPPCTYLSNAGARHLYKGGVLNEERYLKGIDAKKLFMSIYNAPCDKIAIENPLPSKIYKLPEHTQVIQPWQFGHPYTKRTLLWLKGLDILWPTDIVEPTHSWCPSFTSKYKQDSHHGVFTNDRARNRSKTFPGIAKAMANQWGN